MKPARRSDLDEKVAAIRRAVDRVRSETPSRALVRRAATLAAEMEAAGEDFDQAAGRLGFAPWLLRQHVRRDG